MSYVQRIMALAAHDGLPALKADFLSCAPGLKAHALTASRFVTTGAA
jgi:hypothetical protein